MDSVGSVLGLAYFNPLGLFFSGRLLPSQSVFEQTLDVRESILKSIRYRLHSLKFN